MDFLYLYFLDFKSVIKNQTIMGNQISKRWEDVSRSCKNVTCFDNCNCFKCFKKRKNKNERRSLKLEIVSMPYIDADEGGE